MVSAWVNITCNAFDATGFSAMVCHPLRGLLVKSSSIENCKSTNEHSSPLRLNQSVLQIPEESSDTQTRICAEQQDCSMSPKTMLFTAGCLRPRWPRTIWGKLCGDRVSQNGKSCRACWLVCRISSTQKKLWGMTSAEGYLRKFQCAPDSLFTFSLLFLWVMRVKMVQHEKEQL